MCVSVCLCARETVSEPGSVGPSGAGPQDRTLCCLCSVCPPAGRPRRATLAVHHQPGPGRREAAAETRGLVPSACSVDARWWAQAPGPCPAKAPAGHLEAGVLGSRLHSGLCREFGCSARLTTRPLRGLGQRESRERPWGEHLRQPELRSRPGPTAVGRSKRPRERGCLSTRGFPLASADPWSGDRVPRRLWFRAWGGWAPGRAGTPGARMLCSSQARWGWIWCPVSPGPEGAFPGGDSLARLRPGDAGDIVAARGGVGGAVRLGSGPFQGSGALKS